MKIQIKWILIFIQEIQEATQEGPEPIPKLQNINRLSRFINQIYIYVYTSKDEPIWGPVGPPGLPDGPWRMGGTLALAPGPHIYVYYI